MWGRRSGALAVAGILLVATACAQVDPGTEDEAAQTTASAEDAKCISNDDGNDPAIQWQNTTVDIEPTSRFGEDTDIAHIITTIAAAEKDKDRVARALDDVPDAEIEPSEDGRLFEIRQRVDVERVEDEDDQFRFHMEAPFEGTELAKDGDISVVVLLPRSSEGHEDVDEYEVELVSATSDEDVPEPTIHQGDEAIGERTTIAWLWCVDPPIDVIYKAVLP